MNCDSCGHRKAIWASKDYLYCPVCKVINERVIGQTWRLGKELIILKEGRKKRKGVMHEYAKAVDDEFMKELEGCLAIVEESDELLQLQD